MPAELADVVVCRFMGWSWQELMETPARVVDDIRMWMEKQALIDQERAAAQRAQARARRRR